MANKWVIGLDVVCVLFVVIFLPVYFLVIKKTTPNLSTTLLQRSEAEQKEYIQFPALLNNSETPIGCVVGNTPVTGAVAASCTAESNCFPDLSNPSVPVFRCTSDNQTAQKSIAGFGLSKYVSPVQYAHIANLAKTSMPAGCTYDTVNDRVTCTAQSACMPVYTGNSLTSYACSN